MRRGWEARALQWSSGSGTDPDEALHIPNRVQCSVFEISSGTNLTDRLILPRGARGALWKFFCGSSGLGGRTESWSNKKAGVDDFEKLSITVEKCWKRRDRAVFDRTESDRWRK